MNFHVLTLFPDMIRQGCGVSILGRAQEKGYIQVRVTDIRDYADRKWGRIDDYPYGGGAGLVIQAAPVCRAFEDICKDYEEPPRVIYVTPQGRVFDQAMAEEFAQCENLVFLCGHYEGVDERALERIVTDYVSIGDYVLTGGELPAMVMIDAISRLVPGVLNNQESATFESFHDNLLEYPQYTRPEIFEDMRVPEILLSGHHANIERWRREQSLLRTWQRRPDLLEDAALTKEDRRYLAALEAQAAEHESAGISEEIREDLPQNE
ncbi:MAG: tRNA (guanosine(37)-N1)-methyltransferase TrmD [Lachnospiraceae bacterium]|nr:tRNA (guanosine(37)-N1)-methyltransferase TrmD [Lachnospiraceae bacterium]